MKLKPYLRRKRTIAKSVLRLPDLEHAKAAVLNSLTSLDAQRGYRHAIDELVDWYCSEPRLALNRIVVLRYRSHLESRQLAFHIAVPLAHFGVSKRTQQNWTIYSVPPRVGRDTPPQAEALPGPSFFVVNNQSIKLSIEAARKVQERSRALVCESSTLIATAISLIDDRRVASERRKARKSGFRVTRL
jgi:hypothetical protein